MRRPSTIALPARLSNATVAALALVVVPLLHVGNRLSLARTVRLVSAIASIEGPWSRAQIDAASAARSSKRAAHLIGRQDSSCLARSQFVWLMLTASGRAPALWLGAGSNIGAGEFAHAWVELDGRPIGERADVADAYPPFDRPLLPMRPPRDGEPGSQEHAQRSQ